MKLFLVFFKDCSWLVDSIVVIKLHGTSEEH